MTRRPRSRCATTCFARWHGHRRPGGAPGGAAHWPPGADGHRLPGAIDAHPCYALYAAAAGALRLLAGARLHGRLGGDRHAVYLAESVEDSLRERMYATWTACVTVGRYRAHRRRATDREDWPTATLAIVGATVGIGGPLLLWLTGALPAS